MLKATLPKPSSELLLSLLDSDLGEVFLPTSDSSITDIRKYYLRESFIKKFRDEDLNPLADELAISTFLDSNQRCSSYYYCERTVYEEYAFDKIRYQFNTQFDPFYEGSADISLDNVFDHGGVGPGAVREAKSYNFYTKLFDSTLSATSNSLHRHFKMRLDMTHKTWFEAEMLRSHRYGDSVITGSKTSTVPKTVNISRVIATEPNLNMFYQKGLSVIIENRLKQDHNIDLATQPDYNRHLARLGSKYGNYCTIDLKSASDTISLNLLRNVLPSKLYQLLQLLRSPSTEVLGREIELHMVSSMGNGFTFSFQTLMFANLVKACYSVLGIPISENGLRTYSVFGDDIIVTKSAYNFVTQMLEACGFEVNNLKSFSSGPFRESCGADFWDGYLVRGIYLKKIRNQADVNVCRNQIYMYSASFGIPLRNLLNYFDKFKVNEVPLWESMNAGYYATSDQLSVKPRTFKALRPIPLKRKIDKLYPGSRNNPGGVIVSAVGGYLRNDFITLRTNVPKFRYETCQLHAFAWDDLYRIERIHNTKDPRGLITSANLI